MKQKERKGNHNVIIFKNKIIMFFIFVKNIFIFVFLIELIY